MLESTYAPMVRTPDRFGIDNIQRPLFWIDVAPSSLRTKQAGGVPLRYVPFNGGDLLDFSMLTKGSKPRIAVTMGSVVPLAEGLTSLRWLVDAASEIDAEFVLALGTPNAKELGVLPPNIVTRSWIGINRLFATSTAVVHHGGPGTMFAALHAGLPQLVIPRASDQFYNAEALHRRGVAVVYSEGHTDATLLRNLLTDERLRDNAETVREEMRGMPLPTEIAERMIECC